jgi:hypothetical protein
MTVDRPAKIAATNRAAELLREITELEERMEQLRSAVAKRHDALMREFDKHALIVESLPHSNTSEDAKSQLHREIKAAEAVMLAAIRLVGRFESAAAWRDAQAARLLEELWPVLRVIGARERGRVMASFSFWLEKMKRRTNGHATDDSK